MEPSSNRDTARAPRKWAAWRAWGVLAVALVLYVVVFEGLERLVPPRASDSGEAAVGETPPPEATRPEIVRDGDTIRVEVGMHRRSIRLEEGEGTTDDLADCIEEGLERAYREGLMPDAPSSDAWLARERHDREVTDAVDRIVDRCFRTAVLPPVELPEID